MVTTIANYRQFQLFQEPERIGGFLGRTHKELVLLSDFLTFSVLRTHYNIPKSVL
jgi:hypothetical protein